MAQPIRSQRATARLLVALALAAAGASAPAAAVPIVFVVAEHPGHANHGDSYVLWLEDPAQIAHARKLIETQGAAGAAIVVARIAAGADGSNRDVRAPGAPLWSWHITHFEGFADNTIELCDGWPGYVEQDVEGWIENTNGTICFWSYTVVEELPEPDPALGLALGSAALLALARHRRGDTLQHISATRVVGATRGYRSQRPHRAPAGLHDVWPDGSARDLQLLRRFHRPEHRHR